jgi:lipopolysaccharide transport system permease protein
MTSMAGSHRQHRTEPRSAPPEESISQAVASTGDPARATSLPPRVVEIVPADRWPGLDFRELGSYRSLLFLLVWRDLKSRYSQTVLGAGWAVVQPLLPMAIFSLVFGRFARIPSDGVPYPVFSLAALVPWTYFASALSGASGSLILNRNLLTKVYFPRLVIPAAPVLGALVDFAIAFTVLLIVLLGYGRVPKLESIVLLPAAVAIVSLTAMGAGSWLAALSVQYRDVRHLSPFLVQIWMFASPIVYSISMVPESYRSAYSLNPMAGVVTAFRAMLLGTALPSPTQMILSLLAAVGMFLTGTLYFRHAERVFADVA